jgi:copper(I)-binding protein
MNRRAALKLIPLTLAPLAMVSLCPGLIVPALAADAKVGDAKSGNGDLEIRAAWARATRSSETTAYLEIVNRGWTDDTLLSVHSPLAESCVLQQNKWKGMNMEAKTVDRLGIASMEKVRLKPGGYQIQVIGLSHGLSAKDELPLSLTFANAGRIEVTADVTTRMLGPARMVSDHNG